VIFSLANSYTYKRRVRRRKRRRRRRRRRAFSPSLFSIKRMAANRCDSP